MIYCLLKIYLTVSVKIFQTVINNIYEKIQGSVYVMYLQFTVFPTADVGRI